MDLDFQNHQIHQKKFNFLHYLRGFKKECVGNREQNIIREIFWKPNELGDYDRSLEKMKTYRKKIIIYLPR